MLLGAMALMMQAPTTPAALIDALTDQHGYGVIGTSVSEMPPLTIPDPGNVLDVEVRLRNRWRVVRDKAMPGVFRAEAGPYHEVFDESGPGMPTVTVEGKVRAAGGEGTISMVAEFTGAKRAPLPHVERKDLFRPGGVLVSVKRLAELLEVEPKAIPWLYHARTATVRLDPARTPPPLSLLAAMAGAVRSKEKDLLEFEPRIFRNLAVETLRVEATKGVRTDPDKIARIPDEAKDAVGRVTVKERDGTTTTQEIALETDPSQPIVSAISTFERQRPLLLRLGAEAHLQATDAELIALYATPGERKTIAISSFEQKFPEVVQAWRKKGLGRTREVTPRIRLSSPCGLGEAVLVGPDGQPIAST